MKLVSVIVTSYNYGKYLKECIESVKAQTYKNIEIIVVNDGSTDNTIQVCEDLDVMCISQVNQGCPKARNVGADFAQGEYIMQLDGDDTLEPNTIEKLVEVMKDGIGIAQGAIREFGERDRCFIPEVGTLDKVKVGNTIYCNSLHLKKHYTELGGYDENMRKGYEDWEFWLRILKAGYNVALADCISLNYRIHSDSLTFSTLHPNHEVNVEYIMKKHRDLYPIKMLAIADLNNGCGLIREKIPFKSIRKYANIEIITGQGENINIDKYDTIHLSRSYSGDITTLVQAIKQRGKKLVYDTDDALDLVTDYNILKGTVVPALPNYYYLLNQADAITVTTLRLGEHLRKMTPKPIYVLPNALDSGYWTLRPKQSKRLRIGFVGSNTHIKDLNTILPELTLLQRKYKFEFVIAGMSSEDDDCETWVRRNLEVYKKAHVSDELSKEMTRFGELMKQIKHEWHKSVDIEYYPAKLASLDLDIGLCPLVDDVFNTMKSPLKAYEYAMVGTMAITQDYPPFSDEDSPFIKTNTWTHTLTKYIENSKLRDKEAKKQREWVLEEREVSKLVEDRVKIYG